MVALALITVTIRFARPIYQSAITLIAAYVLLFLPRAMVACGPRAAGAARTRGRRPGAGRRPGDAAPGGAAAGRARLFSAAALVFIAVATELTATLLLSPIGTTTLATRFWSLAGQYRLRARRRPYAAMMILISAPVTYLLHAAVPSGAVADERA